MITCLVNVCMACVVYSVLVIYYSYICMYCYVYVTIPRVLKTAISKMCTFV